MKDITLLIADDDEDIRQVLTRGLGRGRRTLLAGDGAAALELARRHLPDLIILDVNMPGRGGLEVCAELRADPRTRRTPIMMLTGLGTLEQELSGLDCGADDYVAKPFHLAELDARVRALLKRRADHENDARA